MSFQQLYNFCESKELPVSTKEIRQKTLEITGISKVTTVRTGLDGTIIRGFYMSPALSQGTIFKNIPGHIVAIARGSNKCWERFVLVKELMHLFDNENEAVRYADQFETLLSEISMPGGKKTTQTISDFKGSWMALAVLCPETHRQAFKKAKKEGRLDDYAIALRLKIPELYINRLLSPIFDEILNDILLR